MSILHAEEIDGELIVETLFLVPLRQDGLGCIINPRSYLEHPEFDLASLDLIAPLAKVIIENFSHLLKPNIGSDYNDALVLCLLNFDSFEVSKSCISHIDQREHHLRDTWDLTHHELFNHSLSCEIVVDECRPLAHT